MVEKEFSWKYTTRMGKTLRRGYTTGSCAAAAAKAAAAMLFGAGDLTRIRILTPQGISLNLPISNICRDHAGVSCSGSGQGTRPCRFTQTRTLSRPLKSLSNIPGRSYG